MDFTKDLDAFLADGEACTIAGVAQVGIFDKAFQMMFGEVAGTHPVLTIKESALGAAVVGSAVVIRSTTYAIASIQPDGTGFAMLELK
jgi:hypothetical protein